MKPFVYDRMLLKKIINLKILIKGIENEFDKKLTQTIDKLKTSFDGKIKDLEKSVKVDGQKNDKLNKMVIQESKICKLGESVAGFTNTLNCETVKANNESRKQVKKMEELEKKLASVIKETNNKVVSEDNGCDNKVDQSTKKGPNTKDWIEEEKNNTGL